MQANRFIALIATVGVLACAAGAAAQGVPVEGAGGSAGTMNPLVALDQQFQQLYQSVNAGLVRVNVTQSALSVLTPEMRADFDRRMAQPDRGRGPDGSGDGRGGRGGGGSATASGRNSAPGQAPAGGRGSGGSATGGGAGGGGGPAFGGRGGPGGPGGPGGFGPGLSGQVASYLRNVAKGKDTEADQTKNERDKAALHLEADGEPRSCQAAGHLQDLWLELSQPLQRLMRCLNRSWNQCFRKCQ